MDYYMEVSDDRRTYFLIIVEKISDSQIDLSCIIVYNSEPFPAFLGFFKSRYQSYLGYR